jgi:hypothetical protein
MTLNIDYRIKWYKPKRNIEAFCQNKLMSLAQQALIENPESVLKTGPIIDIKEGE